MIQLSIPKTEVGGGKVANVALIYILYPSLLNTEMGTYKHLHKNASQDMKNVSAFELTV